MAGAFSLERGTVTPRHERSLPAPKCFTSERSELLLRERVELTVQGIFERHGFYGHGVSSRFIDSAS